MFDITIPHTALRTFTRQELIDTYLLNDARLTAIDEDKKLGLCDVNIMPITDQLDLMTTYRIIAHYNDHQAEMLRKLML